METQRISWISLGEDKFIQTILGSKEYAALFLGEDNFNIFRLSFETAFIVISIARFF